MWEAYCAFYETDVPPRVTAATWARILDPASAVNAAIACAGNGGAVGFANYVVHPYTWSERPACYLEDLFVAPEARGRGVGHALIEHLLELGRSSGWGRLYWMTREDNRDARRLYARFGERDDFVRYVLKLD
jgi:GNAT superfamily N-acetyltransferase